MRDAEGRALRKVLVDLFSRPFDTPLDDEEFDNVARRIFAYQYARNVPYAAFCERRGRTPASVDHWTSIPPVPTGAFREVDLVAGSAGDAEATFHTSGTTRGAEKRGVHYLLDISLYHFAIIPNFAACVLPDGAELTMLSLIPPAAQVPDSSLSHMVSVLVDRMGAGDSAFCASATHGIDDDAFEAQLRAAEQDGRAVCVLGTSFAFVHWLDRAVERDVRFTLPPGSRVMDTGGYKGRSRIVDQTEMFRLYQDRLGIPATQCVNEYGMTELCSQFYDSTLRDIDRGFEGQRRKVVPPWVRTRVVDPETLEPVEAGRGLLQHFDLANAGSVLAIQTEDVGEAVGNGFRVIGRAAGATPRGCSIAMDLLLDAVQSAGG